jgi:anti-sigma-K factor RskA
MTTPIFEGRDNLDDLELFALGMLDEDDARAVVRLLATDPVARERLRELRSIAATLALDIEPVASPPGLKDSILTAARRVDQGTVLERNADQHGPAARSDRPPIRRTPQVAAPWAVAAVLAVALMAVVIWSFSRQSTITQTSEVVTHQVTAVGEGQASGELVVLRGDSVAILSLAGLKPLTRDQVYQVWLIEGEQPVPSSTFHPGNQQFTSVAIPIPDNIDRYDVLAVTVEPEGGSRQPTSKPLLVSDLTKSTP